MQKKQLKKVKKNKNRHIAVLDGVEYPIGKGKILIEPDDLWKCLVCGTLRGNYQFTCPACKKKYKSKLSGFVAKKGMKVKFLITGNEGECDITEFFDEGEFVRELDFHEEAEHALNNMTESSFGLYDKDGKNIL